MPKQGEAKAAIKILNSMELDGSKIRIKKAEEKLTKQVPAKNIRWTINISVVIWQDIYL
jgi:RNA recognition motif-containing protein